MSRNSLNIIDLVKGYLGGDFTNNLSSLLGESTDKTRSGISAAIPSLLSTFDKVASTPDGARRLSSTVDAADDSMLGNISSMFGLGSSSMIERGSNMLGSLLGGTTLSGISGNIARSSGLSGKAVTMLLSVVGPIILGVLKREKQTRGLDSTGLSNLLASQRSNISAAAAAESYPTAVRTEAPARSSGLGWILPLALLTCLGLIWLYSSRPAPAPSTVHAEREATGDLNQATTLQDGIRSAQQSATGILKDITDPVSAYAAASNIRELNSRLDQMHTTFESLPAGAKREVSSLIPTIRRQLKPEIDRVLKIPGVETRIGPLLGDLLRKFDSFS